MVDTASTQSTTCASDWLTFFRQWLRNPRHVASVVPSGRQLARSMAAAIPAGARHVVELGPGTGVITQQVLSNGVEAKALLAVEMNPVLAELLRERFPAIHTACADARELAKVIAATPGFTPGEVDAIVSSLGLLAMPKTLQRDIVAAAFSVLAPAGVFVQYTYGFAPPIADSVRAELGLDCRAVATAWRNVPPARVYVYARR